MSKKIYVWYVKTNQIFTDCLIRWGFFGGSHLIYDKVNSMRHRLQHICRFGCALRWPLAQDSEQVVQTGRQQQETGCPDQLSLHSLHSLLITHSLSQSSGKSSRHVLAQISSTIWQVAVKVGAKTELTPSLQHWITVWFTLVRITSKQNICVVHKLFEKTKLALLQNLGCIVKPGLCIRVRTQKKWHMITWLQHFL